MKKKLFIPLFCAMLFSLCVFTTNNVKNSRVYAEETNSSEVVESDPEQVEHSELYDWLMENKDIINLLAESIAGLVASFGGVWLAIKSIRATLSKVETTNKDNNDNSKAIATQSAEIKESVNSLNATCTKLIETNEELQKEVEEKDKQIVAMQNDIASIKESLKIAYCNDQAMIEDGRAVMIADNLK